MLLLSVVNLAPAAVVRNVVKLVSAIVGEGKGVTVTVYGIEIIGVFLIELAIRQVTVILCAVLRGSVIFILAEIGIAVSGDFDDT